MEEKKKGICGRETKYIKIEGNIGIKFVVLGQGNRWVLSKFFCELCLLAGMGDEVVISILYININSLSFTYFKNSGRFHCSELVCLWVAEQWWLQKEVRLGHAPQRELKEVAKSNKLGFRRGKGKWITKILLQKA